MAIHKIACRDNIRRGSQRLSIILAGDILYGKGHIARNDPQRAGQNDDFIFTRDVFFPTGDAQLRDVQRRGALAGVGAGEGEGAVGDRKRIAALHFAAAAVGDRKRRAVIEFFAALKGEDDGVLPLGLQRDGGGEIQRVAALDKGACAVGKEQLPADKLFPQRVQRGGFRLRIGRGGRVGNACLALGLAERHVVTACGNGGRKSAERAGGILHMDRSGQIDPVKRKAKKVTLTAAVEDGTDRGGVKVLGKDGGGKQDRPCGTRVGLGERKETAAVRGGLAAFCDEQYRAERIARRRREPDTAAAQIGHRRSREGGAGGVFPKVDGEALSESGFDLLGRAEHELMPLVVLCADRPGDSARVRCVVCKYLRRRKPEKLGDQDEDKQHTDGFLYFAHGFVLLLTERGNS